MHDGAPDGLRRGGVLPPGHRRGNALGPAAARSAHGDADVDPPQRRRRFQPFTVTLTDQFEKEDVRVLRPVALCNPVAKCVGKDCTEISSPDDHLTCYALARSSNRFRRAGVVVSNQFGEEEPLTVLDRDILCVPSTKKVVVPPR